MKVDVVRSWLDNVAVSHSDSDRTREVYAKNLQRFCEFIGKTPDQILREYEGSTEREFKRKYAQYVRAFLSAEYQKGLAQTTICCRAACARSFFKYSDLPLSYVPYPKLRVTFHNRDITREEIKLILDVSNTRERAFYSLMAQSGLRPDTLCKLRYKHIKKELVLDRVPCKIEVPEEINKDKYQGHFTFCGEEATRYLKAYLNTRGAVQDGDFLFVKQGCKKRASPKSLSGLFATTLLKLEAKGLIDVEQKEPGKPRNVRLYSLRKWFRKQGGHAGSDFVNFWMGHTFEISKVDDHYFSKDAEHNRKIYMEKALPNLRLDSATPLEHEKQVIEQTKEIEKLRQELATFKQTYRAPTEEDMAFLKKFVRLLERVDKNHLMEQLYKKEKKKREAHGKKHLKKLKREGRRDEHEAEMKGQEALRELDERQQKQRK